MESKVNRICISLYQQGPMWYQNLAEILSISFVDINIWLHFGDKLMEFVLLILLLDFCWSILQPTLELQSVKRGNRGKQNPKHDWSSSLATLQLTEIIPFSTVSHSVWHHRPPPGSSFWKWAKFRHHRFFFFFWRYFSFLEKRLLSFLIDCTFEEGCRMDWL